MCMLTQIESDQIDNFNVLDYGPTFSEGIDGYNKIIDRGLWIGTGAIVVILGIVGALNYLQ